VLKIQGCCIWGMMLMLLKVWKVVRGEVMGMKLKSMKSWIGVSLLLMLRLMWMWMKLKFDGSS